MFGLKTTTRWSVLVLAAAALVGCSDSEQPKGEPGDFVSDNPYDDDRGDGNADTDGADTGDPTGGDEGGGDDGGSRDVAEADIVHIDGDRLYALSPYGGLTIIDVSQPDTLPVLGRFRAHAEPFEMYVEDGQVFIMYQGWGEYVLDEETDDYTWQSTSRLIALDASNPADITIDGDFSMPGWLSDSRRVGDVLYVVTKEDSYCWDCSQQDNATVVTSLDVGDEANVQIVDQLRLQDEAGWGGRRSVSATDERLYIAGPDWNVGPDDNSTIEVVDISDPEGALVKGASIAIAGRIESRWQMDEHDGVLRVVSQPGWSGAEPPHVETFTVASASDVQPLGSMQMTLPRPETLQSVRFDGPRGYAITFERTDPLFTLDLSDPADPQQRGELEIPGFVYHMETRGDRVLGIGFDRDHADGSINASLFDVSDFSQPTMIERVHFGGDWASFAEDQDRLHKSFQVLDELGLLLVPFSGWIYDDENEQGGCGQYQSGIQLVDWADDTLALRGVAPMKGGARRGLVHDERLIGVSDQSVEVFDVSDRDAPTRTSARALAAKADRLAIADGLIVRLANDWWTGETRLEVVDGATPESAEALGALSLDDLVPEGPDGPEAAEWGCVHYGYFDTQMFTRDGFVYLVRNSTLWENGPTGSTTVDVVDITDPTAPTYVDSLEVPRHIGWSYGPTLSNGERAVHMVGDALLIATRQQEWEEDGPGTSEATFEVIDLSNPGAPVHAKTLQRPDGLAHGTLQVFDGVPVSWHMRSVDGQPGKVRYYLERLELPSAAGAEALAPVNVPGAVIAWDEGSHRAVLADFQLEDVGADNEDACWSQANAWWSYGLDRCVLAHRPLHMVEVDGDGAYLLDTVDIEGDDGALRGAAASDDRLFAHVRRGSYEWIEDGEGGGYDQFPTAEVVVFADWPTSDLAADGQAELNDRGSWLGSLTAVGTQLIFRADNGLGTLDASDPAAPTLSVHELWGSYCGELKAEGDMAYCAMGAWGVQAIELD